MLQVGNGARPLGAPEGLWVRINDSERAAEGMACSKEMAAWLIAAGLARLGGDADTGIAYAPVLELDADPERAALVLCAADARQAVAGGVAVEAVLTSPGARCERCGELATKPVCRRCNGWRVVGSGQDCPACRPADALDVVATGAAA